MAVAENYILFPESYHYSISLKIDPDPKADVSIFIVKRTIGKGGVVMGYNTEKMVFINGTVKG